MAVLEQAQADLPRWEFLPGRGGAELLDAEGIADGDFFPSAPPPVTHYSVDAQPGTFALVGQAATHATGKTLNAEPVVVATAGAPAATLASRTLNLAAGAYTSTGQPAAVQRNASLDAQPGTLTFAGLSNGFSLGRSFSAEYGALTYAGAPATLSVARQVSASSNTLSLSGQSAALQRFGSLAATAGSMTSAGQAAQTTRGFSLEAQVGSFTSVGASAVLAGSWVFGTQSGGFSSSGSTSSGHKDVTLSAAGVSVPISGLNAELLIATPNRILTADAGSLPLVGQHASLTRVTYLSTSSTHVALDGSAARTLADRSLSAEAGARTLSGSPAGMYVGRSLSASAGSPVVAGQPSSLAKGATFAVSPSVLVLDGQSTYRSIELSAGPGAVIAVGGSSTLVTAYCLSAEPRTGDAYTKGYAEDYDTPEPTIRTRYGYADNYALGYVEEQASASLLRGRVNTAASGQLTVSGQPAELEIGSSPFLDASAGIFTVGGSARFLLEVDMQQNLPLSEVDRQAIADAAAQAVLTALLNSNVPVPANVKQINNVALTGTGTAGSEWGPA